MGKTRSQKWWKNTAFAPKCKKVKLQKALRTLCLLPGISTTRTPKGWSTAVFARTKFPLKSCLMVLHSVHFSLRLSQGTLLILFFVPNFETELLSLCLSRVSCYSSSTPHAIICCSIFLVVYTTLPNFSFVADILEQMLFAWVGSFFKCLNKKKEKIKIKAQSLRGARLEKKKINPIRNLFLTVLLELFTPAGLSWSLSISDAQMIASLAGKAQQKWEPRAEFHHAKLNAE